MIVSKNADIADVLVGSIEGAAVYGGRLRAKPMIRGDEMTLLEICYDSAGIGAPRHAHDHESLVYVVKGRVRTVIGDEVHVLGPGDVCRHPAGVAHSVEALEATVMVEIKAPAPDIAQFFGN